MYYIIFKKHFKGGRVGDGIDDGALLVTSPTTFWTLITRLFMSFYFTFNPKNGLLYHFLTSATKRSILGPKRLRYFFYKNIFYLKRNCVLRTLINSFAIFWA
jgi:hypothetical protein